MTVRTALLDIRPLAIAPFRRLWIGSSLSQLGGQMTTVAVMVQVWAMTERTLWTGAVGLAHAVPMVIVGLVGGSLADHVDRRRLVLVATVGQFVGALVLAWQGFFGQLPIVALLGVVAAQTAFGALGGPARRTFVPTLLPSALVGAGIALSTTMFQVSMLLGPAAAGVIAAVWGVGGCYLIDALTFGAAFYGVFRLPTMRVERAAGTTVSRPGWNQMVEGLRFVVTNPLIRAAFLTDLAATVLAMPISLFPAINDARFGGSPATLGLFLTAIAVGGLIASVFSGVFTAIPRPGPVMLTAAAVWGLALAAFGLIDSPWLSLCCLSIAGAADTISVVARGTLVQLATPDSHRGRVAAAEQIVGISGPDVGNLRGGLVAGITTPVAAIAVGGLLCVAGVAAVAVRTPGLRRYRIDGGPGPTGSDLR